MKKKIKNLNLSMRYTKEDINYKGKHFKIYVIRDSPARMTPFYGMVVDTKFFNEFIREERVAMLFHEEYHKKILTKINHFFNIIRFLSLRKARWQEEFGADNYSSKKVGKRIVLSFLRKIKKLYEKGEMVYNKKTHPPIKERIRRIEKGEIKLKKN